MPRPKPKRRLPPEVLSNDEVAALLGACDDDAFANVRTRALIAMLYRTGLRLSEALALLPKDIDPQRSCVRVLCGKGGRSRTVGIDAGALAMLGPWIARRAALRALKPSSPVFCTAWGTPLTTAYIRRLLPQLAAKAHIAKRVHAHGFRHTHAAELRAEGVDIGVISKQLGHQDISTTARYLDHIAPWAVVEAVRARRWSRASPSVIKNGLDSSDADGLRSGAKA